MRLKFIGFAGGLVALTAIAPLLQSGSGPPQALASSAPRASGPTVALLATRPGALHTSLYLAQAGGGALEAPVATFTHLPGAVVRGSVVPGTNIVLATADTRPSRDPSFNASLFRLAPHEPPAVLCDDVVHASRPLITPAGRVLIARGATGAAQEKEMRVDALSIDEVDHATGALRTLHTWSGYLAFLAGSLGPDVILYRVGLQGADLVAVDIDSGAVRVIVPSLPPFARDFSVDAALGALVFRGRHETDSRVWTIERVDLKTGAVERLHESAGMSLAPHALPGGAVAYNPDGRVGLAFLGAGPPSRAPLGAGVDVVLATSDDGGWIAALHTPVSTSESAGALPVPFLLNAASGASAPVVGLSGARIAIAGFVPAAGGAP